MAANTAIRPYTEGEDFWLLATDGGAMAFDEHRATLAAELARLEELVRQAREVTRDLDERVEAAEGHTETFADDTALARVRATVKRARQDLGALTREARQARDIVTDH